MMVTMNINNITMPNIYTRTPPKKDKINDHMMHFIEHGAFRKPICITQKGMLLDGYCDFIVAVVCGIDVVECEINTKRLKHGIVRNRKINNPKNKRKILHSRQEGKCAICGKQLQINDSTSQEDYLTFDHILPVCRGGSNGLINLQGLCRHCNHIKNDNLDGLEE